MLLFFPKLVKIVAILLYWNILISECSFRVFHSKVTVLSKSIDLKAKFNALECSIAEVGSINIFFMEYNSILCNIHLLYQHYASIVLLPIMPFITPVYLMQPVYII